MKLGAAIAEIMKREGIQILIGYPVNHLIEYRGGGRHPPDHRAPGTHRAAHGRRHQPRHLRPARSASSACSTGRAPRTPMAASRRATARAFRCWSCRWAIRGGSPISTPTSIPPCRCAASPSRPSRSRRRPRCPTSCAAPSRKLRNGRGGPVLVEIPTDMWNEEVPEPLDYTPVHRHTLRRRTRADVTRRGRRCSRRRSAR